MVLIAAGIAAAGELAVLAQDGDAPAVVELAPSRVARPKSETLRELARLDRFVQDQAWDEVAAVADRLLATSTEGWVLVEPERYEGVRRAIHRRLAALPPAGLAAYRARVDAIADDRLRAGIDTRDESQLQDVVARTFCSSAGDDALWALGEIALQRADFFAARSAWQSVRPETSAAGSTPYPDSATPLAAVRARMALVSIREGDFDRARREIDELAAQHPDDTGRLGGREVNFVERLNELWGQAKQGPQPRGGGDWPTLGANPQRTSVAAVAFPEGTRFERAWSVEIAPHLATEDVQFAARSTTFPVVASGTVAYQDSRGIHTVPLDADDTPVVHSVHAAAEGFAFNGSALTIADRRLFAIVAAKPRGGASLPRTRLAVFDLAREGALLVQLAPGQADAVFVGAPIVSGSQVIVCEIAPPPELTTSLVCYDMWTQRRVWRRTVCWPAEPSDQTAWLATRAALAAAGGVVYVNTNLGAVAAVRADDGEPLWLRTYARSFPRDPTATVRAHHGLPDWPAAARSRVIVAPSDSAHVFSCEAATGASVWSVPRPAPDVRLLAVDGDVALLAGEQLRAISVASGQPDAAQTADALGGAGQGAVAGELVFWPSAGEIHVLDRASGRRAGDPLPLPSGGGANLVVAADRDGVSYVIAAGVDRLTAYRPSATPVPSPPPAD